MFKVRDVTLSVANLDLSVEFYTTAIGLTELGRHDGRVDLGVSENTLIKLVEDKDAARSRRGDTGLFHFALLLPERSDLARWLLHAMESKVPFTGASDHFVSEALYLNDPDGHGIEIYWDRPREIWEGKVDRMTTLPLDLGGLLAESRDAAHSNSHLLPEATTLGHVHLKVAAIAQTVDFYHRILGLDLMARYGDQAIFLAKNGYHHHVGANTWESKGGSPSPDGIAHLLGVEIDFGSEAELRKLADRLAGAEIDFTEGSDGIIVRDPSGNPLTLR
jgi:catechol 2,3-dioxygenase